MPCEGILSISVLEQSGKVEPGQASINLYVYGESDLQYMYKMNLSSDKSGGFCVISEGMRAFVLSGAGSRTFQKQRRLGTKRRILAEVEVESDKNILKREGEVRTMFGRTVKLKLEAGS